MPAIAPIPPAVLQQVLGADGYKVLAEDELNWVMAKNVGDIPIILPKLGELVALDVMMGALNRAQMTPGRFFDLLREVNPASASPVTH